MLHCPSPHAAACLAADVAAIVPRFGSAKTGVKNQNQNQNVSSDAKLGDALMDAEMRLVPALAQMEATGVAFDPSVLCRQIRQANRRLCEIEREADALVWAVPGAEPASLASSADVARVLFEDLKLPPPPCAVRPAMRRRAAGCLACAYRDDALHDRMGAARRGERAAGLV